MLGIGQAVDDGARLRVGFAEPEDSLVPRWIHP